MLLKGRLLLFHKVEFLYDCFHLNKTPGYIQISWAQDSVEKGPEKRKIAEKGTFQR